MDEDIGKDLYAEYPALEKEIHRLLQCIIKHQYDKATWGNIEEAVADLIEKAKK